MIKKAKYTIYTIWLTCIVTLLISYVINPNLFTPQNIKLLVETYSNELMITYISASLIRGLFLIPSTPFVIVGALLFPDDLLSVLLISIISVMFSATLLYYFSDLLGFSQYLERKHPVSVKKWRSRLNSRKSILVTTGWAFFPLVPTDLICYVSGIVAMPFTHMFIGIFLGEVSIISIYLFLI
ncbi:TVP38/TMEM64 family protein [Vibrio sp. MACH09]|uniref:VTT domain-containing protein n=1 Tax=unclassified Vibrio TaxID=2614977 RepID=UPI00149360C3|nr:MULTISPECIES: VTT domain-containing protein [unclassified Vibrio]NOI67794.1 TVP38/TMEM64 family protein [Vibrio sp. 99-8-1]GLO60301.1 TVP38/TMEM64 family protein [Vibrio sp. MACH09]